MKRWLILTALVLLLTLAAGVLVLTPTGLHWVAAVATPAGVEYDNLDGRLVGPISITGLRWQQGDRRLEIDRIELDWEPASLFTRHIEIRSIDAGGVRWQATSDPQASAAPGEVGLPRLPVSVTVDDLRVTDLEFEQDGSAFTVDLLKLSAGLDAETYRIERFELQSPTLDLTGDAAVGLAAPHRVDAALAFAARVGAAPVTVTGTLAARGDSDALQLDVATEGGVVAKLDGRATGLVTGPGFDGRVEIDAVDARLSGLDDDRLELSLDVNASPDRLELDGVAEAPTLLPRPLRIAGSIGLDGAEITVEKLQASIVGTPAELAIAGTLQRDLSALDLEIDWQRLGWPLTESPAVTSPVGRATLSGTLDRYALDLTANVTIEAQPQMRVAVRGAGDATRFDIAEAVVRPAPGTRPDGRDDESVRVTGFIEWQATPAADLGFVARDLRLQRLHPRLEGRLSTDGRARLQLPATGAEIAIDLRSIDGRLLGQRLNGSGGVDIAPDTITLRDVDLAAGDASLQASGTIAERLDLEWDLKVPQLGLLWPAYSGTINTNGRATGPRGRPALQGTVETRALEVATVAIERLTGRFDTGLDPQSSAEFLFDGEGIRINGVSADRVGVESQGTVAAQAISVTLDSPAGDVRAQLAGGLDGDAWRGNVTAMEIGLEYLGEWQLAEQAGLQIQRQGLVLDKACFAQQDSSVCIDGAVSQSAPLRAGFVLDALPVAAFAPLLPPGLQYEGHIAGDGFITLTGASLDGEANFALDPGKVTSREDGAEITVLGYREGRLQASVDDNLLLAELHLDLDDDGVVQADVRTPLQGEGALDGAVQVRIENLNLVPTLIPQIGRIDGSLRADMNLAGTLRAPEASGEIGLNAREMVLPDLGITLRQSELDIVATADVVSFTGQAMSGDGDINLDGTLRWYEGTPVGRLKLNGTSFRAVDLPELRIDASPEVTVSIAEQVITLAGEVQVPAANITPLNINTGIGVSPDQIIVDQDEPASPDERWQVDATLRVTAGDAVRISGFGLKGELTGSVLIVQQPGQAATGRGALEIVDGRYRAYGQDLTIDTGRLEFTGGPIDDPGLDLRASRQSGDVEAGVQVRGALREPVLTLYSSPPLSDTQTLSYLITGQAVEELDEAGQSAVSDAATRLALKSGGSLLARSVGRELGLDTIGFEDEGTTASTALVVGKQLSPRLFVSYGIGLFDAINTVRLRYRINPRLVLETESGVRSSADLLYSFDR